MGVSGDGLVSARAGEAAVDHAAGGDVPIDPSPAETAAETGADTSTDVAHKSCASPLDCGDASLFICDPVTHTCQSPTCDTKTKACPSGKACVPQVSGV